MLLPNGHKEAPDLTYIVEDDYYIVSAETRSSILKDFHTPDTAVDMKYLSKYEDTEYGLRYNSSSSTAMPRSISWHGG